MLMASFLGFTVSFTHSTSMSFGSSLGSSPDLVFSVDVGSRSMSSWEYTLNESMSLTPGPESF